MTCKIARKKAYAHHMTELGDLLHDIEHYRFSHLAIKNRRYPAAAGGENVWRQTRNIAVAVLTTGEAYIGTARLNPIDSWSKSIGHSVAVGRALAKAINTKLPDFIVRFDVADDGEATLPEGRDLRDYCRDELVLQRRLPARYGVRA